jgi:hypothetical protein
MAKRRRTDADRRRERAEADSRARDVFCSGLERAQSYADAKALAMRMPPPDAPGRRFYTSFAFFLEHFAVPGGADYDELQLYLGFIRRLRADAASAAVFKPGALQKAEDTLRAALGGA